MERRGSAPRPPQRVPPLLLVLLVFVELATPPASAAAAPAAADVSGSQLGTTDYRALILIQVDTMGAHLDSMAAQLELTTPTPTTSSDTPQTTGEEREDAQAPPANPDLVRDPLELLPHGRILVRRATQQLSKIPARLNLEVNDTPVETDSATPRCEKKDVNQALAESAKVLDSVIDGAFIPDTLADLEKQNGVLEDLLVNCSLSEMSSDDKDDLSLTVSIVQTYVVAAKAAATPAKVGVEVSSAFMVVLITLSSLMALASLVGLAVLAYRYTTVSTRVNSATKSGGGGGGAQARRDTSQRNPAFQPSDPPGSLHQARNDRWRQPRFAERESPQRRPAAQKSTLSRIWGGVVRDYQRSRDSVAEPPRSNSPPPRRSSPPPRRHSPPPRRASPPPPLRASPPPRRASPPPRRHSPPPQPEGGDNWAYGPTGRNKSTDSPFTSAW